MDKQQIYEILNKAYFSQEPDEKETIAHLPQLLGDAKIFVDIGASLGQYVSHANKIMKRGHIYAIEPDPLRFSELGKNCQKWAQSSDNTLQALQVAASDKKGTISFYVTNSPVSGGLFQHDLSRVDEAIRKEVKWEKITVDAITLDDFFKERAPDIIKIDTEGSELRVLKGSRRILSEGKTKFLIELHDCVDPEGQKDSKEVLNYMITFGYYPKSFYGRVLFARRATLKMLLRRCWRSLKGIFRNE